MAQTHSGSVVENRIGSIGGGYGKGEILSRQELRVVFTGCSGRLRNQTSGSRLIVQEQLQWAYSFDSLRNGKGNGRRALFDEWGGKDAQSKCEDEEEPSARNHR